MSRLTSGLFFLTAVAIVCPIALAADSPAAQAEKLADKGLAFLKTKQQADGTWQTSPRDPPGISALVLRGFAQDKETGPKADFVQKGYAALLKMQKPDGGIYTEGLNTYNTAIAVSALAAADQPELKEPIARAAAYLKGIQYKGDEKDPSVGGVSYGGKGRDGKPQRADLSNTHLYIEALRDAGLEPNDPAFKEAVKFLSRSQNRSESNDQPWAGDDGGFIYTPANGGSSNAGEYTGPDGKRLLRSYGLMTYAGLKSMIYAGLTKDDPRVKAAWGLDQQKLDARRESRHALRRRRQGQGRDVLLLSHRRRRIACLRRADHHRRQRRKARLACRVNRQARQPAAGRRQLDRR